MMFKIFINNGECSGTYSDRFDRICRRKCHSGFVALIAVVILATGTLAFSLATLASAVSYSESIYLHELRIQVGLNKRACLDSVTLMVGRDYFLSGNIEISEFGCVADITNDFNGGVVIEVRASLGSVSDMLSRSLIIGDFLLAID